LTPVFDRFYGRQTRNRIGKMAGLEVRVAHGGLDLRVARAVRDVADRDARHRKVRGKGVP
jgi:hypothetical protein